MQVCYFTHTHTHTHIIIIIYFNKCKGLATVSLKVIVKHNGDRRQNEVTVFFHCARVKCLSSLTCFFPLHCTRVRMLILCIFVALKIRRKSPRHGPHWTLDCNHQNDVADLMQHDNQLQLV